MSGVSKSRAFKKSGVKLQCLTEANPRETTFGSKDREFWIIQYMYSKNQDFSVFQLMLSDWHFKPVLRPKGCLRVRSVHFQQQQCFACNEKKHKLKQPWKLQNCWNYNCTHITFWSPVINVRLQTPITLYIFLYTGIYLAFFYSCSLYS